MDFMWVCLAERGVEVLETETFGNVKSKLKFDGRRAVGVFGFS